MHINKVMSNLGAWDFIQKHHASIYTDINNIVDIVQPHRTMRSHNISRKDKLLISGYDLSKQLLNQLNQSGWNQNRIKFGSDFKSGFSDIDGVKEKIGIDISFGKFAFAESNIFVKFPIFIRANVINVAILVMPTRLLVSFWCKSGTVAQ